MPEIIVLVFHQSIFWICQLLHHVVNHRKKKKGRTDPQDTGNDSHMEQEDCGLHSGKSVDNKKKVSVVKSKSKAASTPKSAEQNNDRFEPFLVVNR